MRDLCHPNVRDLHLAVVLHALGDPVRLSIVTSLASDGNYKCVEIEVPVSKSTASHHFRVLREAGVIQMRASGRCYVNTLRRADLDSRFPGLMDSVLTAAECL